jgi:hypothetical protein
MELFTHCKEMVAGKSNEKGLGSQAVLGAGQNNSEN